MFLPSPETMYAYGGETISDYIEGEIYSSGFLSKTTDGGANWEEIDDSLITSSEIHKVFFINNLGFINSLFNTLRTTNGGSTWESIDLTNLYANKIFFINGQTGYCPHEKKLYKTTNRGLNWEVDLEADTLEQSFTKIISTENYLYLLNTGGAVYKKSID